MTLETSEISTLQMEVKISATPSQVWKSLTTSIGEWWPEEFYGGGQSGSRNFSLETEPGGRMLETWEGGGGLLWGTVIGVESDVRLQILGTSFPGWGGPNQWFGTWDLVPSGNETILRFSEHAIGHVSKSGNEEKDRGWNFLWAVLKSHAEGKPAPAWVD